MNNCVPEKKQSVPRMYGECIVVRGTGGARGRWSLWAVWGWGKTLKQLKSYFNSLFPRAGLSSLGLCFRFQWRIYIYIYGWADIVSKIQLLMTSCEITLQKLLKKWEILEPQEQRRPWWPDLWDQAPCLCSSGSTGMSSHAEICLPAMV